MPVTDFHYNNADCKTIYILFVDNGGTDIEGIRLQGTLNEYSGRVEVLYNGTWGTICAAGPGGWDTNEAQVACR